jgi:hypothetical protein
MTYSITKEIRIHHDDGWDREKYSGLVGDPQ